MAWVLTVPKFYSGSRARSSGKPITAAQSKCRLEFGFVTVYCPSFLDILRGTTSESLGPSPCVPFRVDVEHKDNEKKFLKLEVVRELMHAMQRAPSAAERFTRLTSRVVARNLMHKNNQNDL